MHLAFEILQNTTGYYQNTIKILSAYYQNTTLRDRIKCRGTSALRHPRCVFGATDSPPSLWRYDGLIANIYAIKYNDFGRSQTWPQNSQTMT